MPGKYEAMPMDKLKTKPRYTKINETLARFSKNDKDNKPGPLSYDVAGAIEATQWKKHNKNINTFGSEKRKSIFAEIAHRNKSPGAGSYHNGMETAYGTGGKKGALSRSPSLAKARH